MSTTKLSERARPGSECAPWVHAEIVKLESQAIEQAAMAPLLEWIAEMARSKLAEKDVLLRQALDVIESECWFGGTNTYDPRVICYAIRNHLGVNND
jgi:hypothetical protein